MAKKSVRATMNLPMDASLTLASQVLWLRKKGFRVYKQGLLSLMIEHFDRNKDLLKQLVEK